MPIVAPFMVMQIHQVNFLELPSCIGPTTHKQACLYVCVRPVLAWLTQILRDQISQLHSINMFQLMHPLRSQIAFDFESKLGWQFHESGDID